MSNAIKTVAAASLALGTFNVLSAIATSDSTKKITILDYKIDVPENHASLSEPLEPIFMLHGWPDNQAMFEPLKNYFISKGKYAVIRVSLPNYENRPRNEMPFLGYTLDETSDMYYKTINKVLKEETKYRLDPNNVGLVCHDWGSVITFLTLSKYPTLCKRLIILDVGVPPVSPIFIGMALAYQTPLVVSYFLGTDFLVDLVARIIQWKPYPGGPSPNSSMCWPYFDAWRELFMMGPGVKRLLNFVPHKDTETIFIYGESMPSPMRFYSSAFEKNLICANPSKNRFVGVKGDHWFIIKHPERVFKVLDSFLFPNQIKSNL